MATAAEKDDIASGHADASRGPLPREGYLSLRRRYEPEEAFSLIVVAESPPQSGKYFYNPDGEVSEPLFAALMKALGISPSTKPCGLRAFRQRGWILIDATYEPVNGVSNAGRGAILDRDYPLLRDDLARLTPDRSVPLILIKANVCRILEPRLTADGFSVLNRGRSVPFPSHGWQKHFHHAFGAVLKDAGVSMNKEARVR
jgi:hypothetical protein